MLWFRDTADCAAEEVLHCMFVLATTTEVLCSHALDEAVHEVFGGWM